MLFNPPRTFLVFFSCNDFFLLIGHQGDPFPLALCPHRQKRKKSEEKIYSSHIEDLALSSSRSIIQFFSFSALATATQRWRGLRERKVEEREVNLSITSLPYTAAMHGALSAFFPLLVSAFFCCEIKRRTLSKAFDISLDPGWNIMCVRTRKDGAKKTRNGEIDDFPPSWLWFATRRLSICCQRTHKVDYITLLKHHMRGASDIDNFKDWPAWSTWAWGNSNQEHRWSTSGDLKWSWKEAILWRAMSKDVCVTFELI